MERVPNAAQNQSMASDVVGCFPAEALWGTVSLSPKELLLGRRFDQNRQRPGFKNPEL